MTEYYLPTGYGTSEFVEKKSRFIGEVWRISTEEEARQKVAAVKKKYHDARHSCWCYLLREGGVVRYSDDGEPQGTAGQPMLGVFEKEGITDLVCVVTRYFGGILLGTGGLLRAYTKGAKDALDAAGVSVVRRWVRQLVPCTYSLYERLKQETERFGAVIEDTEYGADIVLTVLVPEEQSDAYAARILDFTAGTVETLVDGEVFQPVPVRPGTQK